MSTKSIFQFSLTQKQLLIICLINIQVNKTKNNENFHLPTAY